MKNSILNILTSILLTIVSLTLLMKSCVYSEETNKLQEELIEKDKYIEQYIQTIYYLKDEFVLNETNEKIIHKLDSISYIYFDSNRILDYNLYALDINYYQEQLRYNKLEKHKEEIKSIVLPEMN
mgnify:CR=1 FL=1